MGKFDKGFLTGTKVKGIALGKSKGGFTSGLKERAKKIGGDGGFASKNKGA